MSALHRGIRTIAAAAVLSALAPGGSSSAASQTPTNQNTQAQALDAFTKRMHEYVVLHRKIEGGLPRLSDSASPQQIDTFQRELGKDLTAARTTARQGDIFGDAGPLIRRLLAPVFRGAEGARVVKAIVDEPHPAVPRVNARYPDEVPLSTMPPAVLKVLPKLEEEIEYRFIGRHLILLDPHAHLVVDVIDNVLPA